MATEITQSDLRSDYPKVRQFVLERLEEAAPGQFVLEDNRIYCKAERSITVNVGFPRFGWVIDSIDVDFNFDYEAKKYISTRAKWSLKTEALPVFFDVPKVLARVKLGVETWKEVRAKIENAGRAKHDKETKIRNITIAVARSVKKVATTDQIFEGVFGFKLPNGITGQIKISTEGATITKVEIPDSDTKSPEEIERILTALKAVRFGAVPTES